MTAFVKEVYASFWHSGSGPMLGVAFALLPMGAMALAYAMLSTIQVDYGLDSNQIARLQVYNTLASALGCIAGGLLGDRFGAKRVVAAGFLLSAIITFSLGWQISSLGLQSVPREVFYSIVIAHGLFFGMSFGVRNAIFMGMSNLAISFANYWQGAVAERIDYATVFYLDALFGVLVILLIPFLRDREATPGKKVDVAGQDNPELEFVPD